jgi:hypothetical protein
MGDVLYFFYSYIGNLQYCFEFAPLWTREIIILANPLDVRMTCYLEAICRKELFHPMASTGGSHFGTRTHRAEKGGVLSHAQRGL